MVKYRVLFILCWIVLMLNIAFVVFNDTNERKQCTEWGSTSIVDNNNYKIIWRNHDSIIMSFSHLRSLTSICEPLCIWTRVSTYVLHSHAKYKLSISLRSNEKQQIEHKTKWRKKQRNIFYHQLYWCTGLTDGYNIWTYKLCYYSKTYSGNWLFC